VLTVYTVPVSLYCAKLRIVLRHKRLDWQELPPPGGYGSEEYSQIVPSGNLPALLDGDLLLADSEAIAEYLNEKYPDFPLLPREISIKAKIRERSRFHDTRLEPQIRTLFPHIDSEKRDTVFVAQQTKTLNQNLMHLSQLLKNSELIFHENLTLGDCGFAISFVWIDHLANLLDIEINWPEPVQKYRLHIGQFAAIKQELDDYLPKLSAWLTAANSR